MRQAGQIFQLSTGGSFVGIEEELDCKDNPILVGKRQNGDRLPIDRMSKGARDQLYLSLRLAYLQEYAQKTESIPFIGDDLLTAWDDNRVLAGVRAIGAPSSRIQPILFTYHSRILELAQSVLRDSLDIIQMA